MEKFSLIQSLQNDEPTKEEAVPVIEYQQYEVEVEGEFRMINIPLREVDAFEESASKLTDGLTTEQFRELLRVHRGTRG